MFRQVSVLKVKNILSKWKKGIQWITFDYSDATVNEKFFENAF